jgi:dTMP kinase
MKKGKLIIIDGTDGSGKKTQVDLLAKRLEQEGHTFSIADFPQYGKPSAYYVEQYLNGNFGTLEQVDGYQASLFFALDRYDASFKIRKGLSTGAHVISNRYVSSNMGHQGATFKSSAERGKFLTWLHALEYDVLKVPKPDLSIVLHVPAAVGQELVDKKGHREYVGGEKRDLLEENLDHLRAAEQVYLEIAKFPGFTLIECMKNGILMTREEIHELIWSHVEACIQK